MHDLPKQQNPVILVHGIWDSSQVFAQLQQHLEAQGFTVYSLDLRPPDGSLPLDALAQQLDEFVQQTIAPEQSFNLVGFSMGGIVSRYYLQRLDGLRRVRRFITIASPHQGTILAWLSRKPGAKQMHPFSRFLNDLNQDIDCLQQVRFTSIWTPLDLMIVPAWSSLVPSAQTHAVLVPLHKWMIEDTRVFAKIMAALEAT